MLIVKYNISYLKKQLCDVNLINRWKIASGNFNGFKVE
jgi:hypothetical protein